MQVYLRTAHEYWGGCVHESWETLTLKLDTFSARRCEHGKGKRCIPCKLSRRTIINSFLWADFVTEANTKNTKYLEVIKMVLDNTIMIIVAQCVHAKEGWTSLSPDIRNGEKALLKLLREL